MARSTRRPPLGLGTGTGVASGASPTPAVDAGATRTATVITTDGTLAMRNLDGDLEEARRRVSDSPDDVGACLALSGGNYLRARVTGDLDDMASAVDQTTGCARAHPESADAWVVKATQEQSLHRFVEARADLARARKLGADEALVAGIERELDWNAGKWRDAARSIRVEAERSPTLTSVARLARLEHDLGHYDAADALFGQALSLYEGTGPIPVAMIELQRGMNLTDAGRLEHAAENFRSAMVRLPAYTAAKEHLAETLHRLGHVDEATALYEELTKSSTDPEFVGALAALYRMRGRAADADALRARATKRYEQLLAKYPEAMAWHASEYFLGEGNDSKRALSLLRKNVELRPTPESLEALARMERDAGDALRADGLVQRSATIRMSALADVDAG